MSANVKIGANSSDFQKQMTEMTRQLKVLGSQFNLSSTQAKLFGKEADKLKVSQSELSAKMKIQNSMVELQQKVMQKLNQDLDKQKQARDSLNKKIEETSKKYKEAVDVTGKNSAKSKELKQELNKLKESYAVNDRAIETTNKKLDQATVKMNKSKKALMENQHALDEVNKKIKSVKLDNVTGKLDKVSKATGSISSKMAPLALGITGAGVVATKFSMDYQDGLANINTLLDDHSHLDGYKNKIMDVSNQTGMDLKTVTDGMYTAISSIGDGGKETELIFDTMAKGAKAGGAAVADSVALISAGMKGYGQVNNETAKKISDLAFQTAKLGVTTFPEMAASMQPLFPLASGLNVKMTDLYGSMATLTGVTGNTSEVSTQLKAVFSNLMRPTGDMQKVMQKYGYANGQAMIKAQGLTGVLKIVQKETGGQSDKMAKLFSSTEATTAMTALCGQNFSDFTTKTKAMESAAGSTDTALKKINDTTGNNLRTSLNKAKNSMIQFGEILSPVVSKLADGLSKVTGAFNSLSEGQRKVVLGIGAGVVGFTGLFFGVSKVTGAVSDAIKNYKKIKSLMEKWTIATKLQTAAQRVLNFVMNMNPIGLIVMGIAALIAGLVLLYKKCEWFRNGVNALGKAIMQGIKSFPKKFKQLKDKIVEILVSIKNKAVEVWNSIKNFFTTSIPNFLKWLWEQIKLIPKGIGEGLGYLAGLIVKGIMGIWSFITKTIPNGIAAIIKWFMALPGKLWNALLQAINNIAKWGSETYEKGRQAAEKTILAIIDWFKKLPSRIWQWLCSACRKVIDWGSNLWDAACDAGGKLVDGIVDTVKNLPSKMLSIGKDIVKGIWEGITSMGSWILGGIGDFCGGLVDGFKGALDIHSPSRVLKNEVGKYMAQGVGVGYIEEMDHVNLDIKQSLNRTINTNIKPTISNADIDSINSRLNTNTTNNIFVIVENTNTMDGEVVSKNVYKKVARKIKGDKDEYRVSRGKKGDVRIA